MSDFKDSFNTEIDIFKASKGVIGAELRSKYRKTPLWALFRTVSRTKSKIMGEDYLGYNRGETVLKYSREYLNNNKTPSFTWIHLMDALRHDHFTQEITPNLVKIAQEGVYFKNMLAGNTATLKSIPCILCSSFKYDPKENIPTILQKEGYLTAAFHSNRIFGDHSQ